MEQLSETRLRWEHVIVKFSTNSRPAGQGRNHGFNWIVAVTRGSPEPGAVTEGASGFGAASRVFTESQPRMEESHWVGPVTRDPK